jgi:hypothetical protein
MGRDRHFPSTRTVQLLLCYPAPGLLRTALVLLSFQFALAGSGCASTAYRYGRFHPKEPGESDRQPIVVERGKPHKTLDRLAWVAGIPSRVFTLNSKTNNHDVSEETIAQLTTYLEENDLSDVYVAVNDYNPKLQWRRLRENWRVSPFWRYTVGTGSWLGYTLLPNRVVGGDEYNPFTNTLIVSSDVPALVLAEAAYAKDIRSRRHPGLYAAVNDLPVVSLWRHSLATSDVLGYARAHGDWETERQAYQVLYPQIGSTTFGPASHFVPVAGPFLSATGALVGHATGRTVAKVQEPIFLTAASGEKSRGHTVVQEEQIVEDNPPARGDSPSQREPNAVIRAGYEETE